MSLTFFMFEQFIEKEKNQFFPLYNNKTDVFSEFVNQFFGVDLETAFMKMFKRHLTMYFHKPAQPIISPVRVRAPSRARLQTTHVHCGSFAEGVRSDG